jgi:hypothetical protein
MVAAGRAGGACWRGRQAAAGQKRVQGQRAQSRGAQGQWQAWQAWQACRRGGRAVDAKNRGKLRAGRWVAVPKDAVGGQSAVCGLRCCSVVWRSGSVRIAR